MLISRIWMLSQWFMSYVHEPLCNITPLIDLYTEQCSAFINVSHWCNESQLVDCWFFNCLPYQHFFSNLDLISVSHVMLWNSLFTSLYMFFYSNGRPVVALATGFALVFYLIGVQQNTDLSGIHKTNKGYNRRHLMGFSVNTYYR